MSANTGLSVVLVLLTKGLCKVVSSEELPVTPGFESCKYGENMCDIDAELCLRKRMFDGYVGQAAAGLVDRPGPLFLNRGDVNYRIEIPEKQRGSYAKNLTYTIVRRNGKWSKPWSLEVLSGCCSLHLDSQETCRLPRRSTEGERFAAFLPSNRKEKVRFFLYEIEEKPEPLKWCTQEDETGCWGTDSSGHLKEKYFFEPMNSEDITIDAFCFSLTPQDLHSAKNVRGLLVMPGEFRVESRGIQLPNGTLKPFIKLTDVRPDDLFNVNVTNGDEHVCCVLGDETRQGSHAACSSRKRKGKFPGKKEDQVLVAVISVVCIFMVLGICTLTAVWLQKKYFNECSYRRWKKNAPHHLRSEILEDPPRSNTKGSSDRLEIVEMTWIEGQKDEKTPFQRPRLDSGFQDYACSDNSDKYSADDCGHADRNEGKDLISHYPDGSNQSDTSVEDRDGDEDSISRGPSLCPEGFTPLCGGNIVNENPTVLPGNYISP